MLELPDKDFTPAIIQKSKGAIMNMLETNENVDRLSKERRYKEEPNGILELKL